MNSASSLVKIPNNFYTYVKEAVEEELNESAASAVTKRELWQKMGNELEIAGYPKDQIAKKIQTSIEEKLEAKLNQPVKINTAHYYQVMNENSWTDQSFAHHTKEEQEIDPVRDRENSSYIVEEPQETPNARAINTVRGLKQLCVNLEHSLKNLKDDNNNLINLEDIFSKKELNEFFDQADSIIKITANAANAKTVVPPNTHGIFKDTFRVQSGLLNVARVFLRTQIHMIENIKKTFLTKKQAGKFARGMEPNPLRIFVPKSREEAIFMDFFGLSCPSCSSWRVQESTDASTSHNLKCIDCLSPFSGVTVTHCSGFSNCGMLFYLEELQEILETGKCPGCKKDIKLPKHLIDYAKSN